MNYLKQHLREHIEIAKNIDLKKILLLVNFLHELRKKNGRLFILGIGGSAANASHAVNDFRKLCSIESYAPTDNVSELTARTNDEGWITVFENWLKISKVSKRDALLIFSVGGGDIKKKVSENIVRAIKYAKNQKSKILSIVGRSEGYAGKNSDISIIIPNINKKNVTPHSEAYQSVIWHMIISHPKIKQYKTKW
jgi:D-sedoheptulose 7-phosphate isomerase